MSVQISHKRDTAANWNTANPTLAVAEIGVEVSTQSSVPVRIKIGDGATKWQDLPYWYPVLPDGIVKNATLAAAAVTVDKMSQTGQPDETKVLYGDGTWRVPPAAGTGTGGTAAVNKAPRIVTTSGTFTLDDQIVESDSVNDITMVVPMGNKVAWATTDTILLEAARVGTGALNVSPYIQGTMQRLTFEPGKGLRVRAPKQSAYLRKRVLPIPARPTTGLLALLDANSLGAIGTAIDTWPETSGNALPALTQATASARATVGRGTNGNKTAFFNAGQFYMLTGNWLKLARNRTDLMIFITVMSEFPVNTGDRTLLSLSCGDLATKNRLLMLQRDVTNGTMLVGGRNKDADSAGIFVNAGPTLSPDVAMLGARWKYGTSDLESFRNGALVNSQTAFQADGASQDNDSLSGAIGAGTQGTANFYQGHIMEIAAYLGSDSVLAAYQNYASLRFGEEWIVSGDNVA